jgi:ubiquinone/menaquinone biosynthesis C-methylase UbiE
MSLWGRIFAAGYDRMLDGSERAGLRDRRRELLAGCRGRVLEIGAGTGLNVDLYPPAVEELVLTEPEEPMAKRLERRLAASGRSATVVRAPAERLPFPDASFDTVLCTLVLCTVADPAASLHELRRVLKHDGRLLFLEHVRADATNLARWQDRIHPVWVRIGHGCHCNRDTLTAIGSAGFEIDEVEHGGLPKAAPFVRPMIVGRARARGA